MGLSDSKPEKLSKEERKSRDVAKVNMAQQRKEDISQLQQKAFSTLNRVPIGNDIVGEREIKDVYTFLHVTEKAKSQLEREGAALIKADLIAILIALEPSLKDQMRAMDGLRVTDLNAMIRSIIYDPQRIMSTSGMSTISLSTGSSKNMLI